MWTHKRPYERSRLTRHSIRYHGAVGLYRALNVGNLVGFIGSGVTVAYGRPTWQQLVNEAYEYVKDHYEGNDKRNIDRFSTWVGTPTDVLDKDAVFGLGELWNTLKTFHKQNNIDGAPDGERLKIILEMCENLAHSMDLCARRLSKSCFHAVGLRLHICQAIRDGNPRTRKPHENPLSKIYYDLGVRRLLTVNYDVEIERFLRKDAGFSAPPTDGNDFDKLLGSPLDRIFEQFDPRDANQQARFHTIFCEQATHLTSRDNLGRSVETVRLIEASLGDLIAFATFPRSREAQIFHLHGRLDDPKALLVTEGDYQRVYLRSGTTHRTFEEALDTLFLGNDVLFVGLGMNEADLLRPLRQFVVTDRLADVEARRIFALLPYFGEQKAVERALDLKIRYGAQTLFFGEGMNWALREFLEIILKWLLKRSAQGGGGNADEEAQRTFERYLESLLNEFRDFETPKDVILRYSHGHAHGGGAFENSDLKKLWTYARESKDEEFKWLLPNLLKQPLKPFDQSIKEPLGQVIVATFDDKWERIHELLPNESIKTLQNAISELQTQALCKEIELLASGRRTWWEDWLAEPLACTAPYAYLPANDYIRAGEICVRHQPHYISPPHGQPSSLLTEMMKPLTPSGERRILRLSNERGTGKGHFFHELQSRGNYKILVPEKQESLYRAAFFAHTSFSPEFSSIVAALVRFVARHTATPQDLARANKFLRDERRPKLTSIEQFEEFPELLFKAPHGAMKRLWSREKIPNMLSQLRQVLLRFQATMNPPPAPSEFPPRTIHEPRLFICLNGLERLCDSKGNAYSSGHRSFFRMLTDKTFEALPIDLVLIAGDPGQPIRYLSQEENNVPQPWQRLRLLPLEERTWLTVDQSVSAEKRYVTKNRDLTSAPILAKLMEESVALDSWISLCANVCFEPSGPPKPGVNEAYADKKQWIKRLENAAGRNRGFEVLSELFQTYRWLDRAEDKPSLNDAVPRPPASDIRELILHHLSFFSLPIHVSALLTCPDIRRLLTESQQADEKDIKTFKFDEERAFGELLTHLNSLHERGLLILVHSARRKSPTSPIDPDPFKQPKEHKLQLRFALHGRMRQYLAGQMRFALPDRGERNYYGVSLYTVQPRDLPTPSEVHFRRVYRIVEDLLYAARNTLRPFYEQNDRGTKFPHSDDIHALPQLLRSAYSIVRESFSIGSLSRLKRFEGNPADPGEPYEIYRGLLGALISAGAGMKVWNDETLAQRLSGLAKPKLLKHYIKDSEFSLEQPYYSQEILWLINERGLTAFVQGRLYDAIPLFNQAIRIANQVTDGGDDDDSFRANERRIQLNLAVAEIERGNIRRARRSLEKLAQRTLRTETSTPSTTKELADGYLGLCDHLSGHLRRAEVRYRKVLRCAERLESMRTLAIFHRHFADMLRLLKRTDEAQKHLRLATLAAARDEQKDVFQYAQIAQARLYRDVGDRQALKEASRLLDEAERYAKELGLIKLEVEALKARSTIILAQGETEQAGRLAARAVGLANRHGMELHKISGLVIHGRILLERGQSDLAHAVLKECSSEADRRGYQLAAIFADRLLRISPQPEDVDELGTIWVKGDPI